MRAQSAPGRRVPRATYRVQLTPEFGFLAAAGIVPYLSRLGISDLYCSPILTARPGSTHGYDVIDPRHINPELGGKEAFDSLVRMLHEHRMGLLLDIVPNHMAADPGNPWWLDVLEHGPDSEYAAYFDIEWEPAGPGAFENRVLLPILGSPYGEALENGELKIEPSRTSYRLRYYETELPLATDSLGPILKLRANEVEDALGTESPELQAYSRVLQFIDDVSNNESTGSEPAEARRAFRDELGHEISRLCENPAIGRELELAVEIINGTPGDPRSFDVLDQIVSSQAYRLSFWQLAREQINYRRFFDINDLVSMRVEDDTVFESTHDLVLRLVREGKVNGLRIDHVDGLWDPERYLERLQCSLAHGHELSAHRANPYVVVEKILAEGERLPEAWPVDGTTGYDFTALLNGLLVDSEGLEEIGRMYRDATGIGYDFSEMVYRAKRLLLEESFTANVESLSSMLGRIADQDRHGQDLTIASMREAIIEVTAQLPVYRTYVDDLTVSERDARWIEKAVDLSMTRRPDLRHSLAFLRRVLLLQIPPYISTENRAAWLQFVMRWQQMSGPDMAKGCEDTALYQHNRLLSLNEVGSHPDTNGVAIQDFHARNLRTASTWPHTLNATSTHDTKRSEDVRARIAVLSEIPGEWRRSFSRWHEMNDAKRPIRNGIPIPDANVEIQIYQTLLGAWPNQPGEFDGFRARVIEYLIKASREAKTFTRWTEIDAVYESALVSFVESILDPHESPEFLADLARIQESVGRAGAINSLSQTLLKLTAPGVPDTYQGTEFWDYSLVDPDNRRSVDYTARRLALDQILEHATQDLGDLMTNWTDGRIKQYLIHRGLLLRDRHARLFATGSYQPLDVQGADANHVIAFCRSFDSSLVVVVAPRCVAGMLNPDGSLLLRGQWRDTRVEIPGIRAERLRHVLADQEVVISHTHGSSTIMVNDVLERFPCGLLVNEG